MFARMSSCEAGSQRRRPSSVGTVRPGRRSALRAGTAGTCSLPNTSSELAILAETQTFTRAKIFSVTLVASGATATIGTAPGTATYGLGTGATAFGATKTVNLGTGGASGSDTVVNIGSDTPGADGVTVINTPTVTFANGVTVVGMPQANLTALLLGLGGTVADAYNRLSINTPAVLLNNAGAGIEATVNKAAAGNDAAFAFKTGFSARALIGLLGSDDFSFKVSPDGAAYFDAMLIDRNTGRVELPKPAILPAASIAPAAPASGRLALYARVGQARALRPHTRRPALARSDAADRAGVRPAAASRAGPPRDLAAVVRRHRHHRGHVELHSRYRFDPWSRRDLPRHQHAPLATDLGGRSGLGLGPAQQRLHLLARQRRRARRLDLSDAPLARHPAGDRHGFLWSLRLDRGARHHPGSERRR